MLDLRRVHGLIDTSVDRRRLEDPCWQGSFGEYLSLVLEEPRVARSSRQRLHALLSESAASGGTADPLAALSGRLAAMARGQASRRCGGIVVPDPDGESATRLFGLLRERAEEYSRTPAGALFTVRWSLSPEASEDPDESSSGESICPVHDEPLRLVPPESRRSLLSEVNESMEEGYPLAIDGPPCAFCRSAQETLLKKYQGDWARMIEHVHVVRLPLSQARGVGFGTLSVPEKSREALDSANRGLLEIQPGDSSALQRVLALLADSSSPDDGPPVDVVLLWALRDRGALEPTEAATLGQQTLLLEPEA